jgi:hypothetical protein
VQKEGYLVKLPGLDALNTGHSQQRGAALEQSSSVRQSKKVQFQKDILYDDCKVPKRGSSRGTSMASSNK